MRPVPNLELIILCSESFGSCCWLEGFVVVIITRFIYSQRVFRSTLHNTIIIHLVTWNVFVSGFTLYACLRLGDKIEHTCMYSFMNM